MDKCKTIKDIHDGIVEYILDTASFESNDVIEEVSTKITRAKTIEDIFRIPIDDRLFGLDDAMKWLFFIVVTLTYMKDEDITIPNAFNISFSLNNAFLYLTNTYSARKDDCIEYYEKNNNS